MRTKHTLTDQLIGRQILLLAVLVLLIALSQFVILRAVLLNNAAHSLHQEIAVLGPVIHRQLMVDGQLQFRILATVLSARLSTSGVNLIIADNTGQIVSTSPRLIGPTPPPVVSGHYFLWRGYLVVSSRLGDPYFPDGRIWLLSPMAHIDDILSRDIFLVAALGALMLAVAAWVGSVLVRRSLVPLEKIRASTIRIAQGDIGHTTNLGHAPAELAELGDAINTMSLAIKELFDQEKLLAEQMRRFVADASHELRTPLTAINGFLSIIQQDDLSPEERQRGMNTIRHEGHRMARLVNQLLTLSRIDTLPQTAVAPVPLDLEAWVRHVKPMLAPLVKPHRLDYHITPVTVIADPDRLTEIVLNLVENAARYSPPGDPIDIVISRNDDYGIVEVKDVGPGLNPQDLPHIFDRFYRSDQARTSSSGGTGLGLSIVAALTHAQGGTVEADNRPSPEHGAIFRVKLPIASSPPESSNKL
jgi:two-component system OmpR family sensor kinase